MATDTKKKPESKSTERKSTAKGATKTPDEKRSPEAKQIDELRDKRASFDQPVVDTPVPVADGGETETTDDSKDVVLLVPEGSSARLSIGNKSVVLDGEGVKSLQRHLSTVAAGL